MDSLPVLLPSSSSQRPLKLFIGTFNVNEQLLPTNLDDWLHTVTATDNEASTSNTTSIADDVPDILVFAFQELYPLPWAYVYSLLSFVPSLFCWDSAAECRRQVDAALRRRWPSNFPILPRRHSNVVDSSIGPSFTMVGEHRRVGLSVLVFTRDSFVTPFVQSVQVADIGTGFLGVMGNKGAVAIRLGLGTNAEEKIECRTTLCFVNVHFAAHEYNFANRNRDFWDVLRRMTFKESPRQEGFSTDETAPLLNKQGSLKTANRPYSQHSEGNFFTENVTDVESSLFDNDHLFLVGDLNYRVICSHPRSGWKTDPWNAAPNISFGEILSLLSDNKFHALACYDQLGLAQAAAIMGKSKPQVAVSPTVGQAAVTMGPLEPQVAAAPTVIPTGFQEGNIFTFRPSYKFKVGTDKYDITSPSRLPSWCDRILWYTDVEEEASPQANSAIIKTSGVYGQDPDVSNKIHAEISKTCLLGYTSHASIRTSDHLPVSAIFALPIFTSNSPILCPACPNVRKRRSCLRPPRNWTLDPDRVVKSRQGIIADTIAGVLFAFPFLLFLGTRWSRKLDGDRNRTKATMQRIAAFVAIAAGTWIFWSVVLG